MITARSAIYVTSWWKVKQKYSLDRAPKSHIILLKANRKRNLRKDVKKKRNCGICLNIKFYIWILLVHKKYNSGPIHKAYFHNLLKITIYSEESYIRTKVHKWFPCLKNVWFYSQIHSTALQNLWWHLRLWLCPYDQWWDTTIWNKCCERKI